MRTAQCIGCSQITWVAAITTNSGGGKTGELRYYPFGSERYNWGNTPTTYRFTGQRSEEAGIGLYFNRARWYDPALGRFVQADTIVTKPGNLQAHDRYAYVFNNPIRYTDPSGHRLIQEGDGGSNDNLPQPETGPVTTFLLQLPGTAEDWVNAATVFDGWAWGIDLLSAGVVTSGGIAGAGIPAALLPVGIPEVPVVTGLAGIAIAELFVQPTFLILNSLATISTMLTIVADTKAGNTRIEEGVLGSSAANSIAFITFGWLIPEAYTSLIMQSLAVANDFDWISFPWPDYKGSD